jgi:hypothetical protein
VIDPFSAATLGGLAYDTTKTAITKWVGTRIAAGIDTAPRGHRLKQGRPANDQQAELTAVIKAAVELTAAELFPDQERLQKKFCKALLAGEPTKWPLVGGSDLTDLVADVHAWISENDPHPGSHQDADDPAAHQYLSVLCRNIIVQFGFRAECKGAKNTILYPRWNRFWITELFTSIEATAAPPAAGTEFRNDFSAPIGIVIQAQQVTLGSRPEPPPTWPCRIGSLPPIAAAHQDRPVDQELAEALSAGGTAVVCQILSGMGGVGKTQIAAAFAHRQWDERAVDLLVWINASARESIIAAFAQAGSKLCGADAADSEATAQHFLAWLDSTDAPRWLIVLDDLTNPTDLGGLWPPSREHSHTIVTTRRRDAALETHARERIDVDLYTPNQALAYLTDRLTEPGLLNGAANLAHDLGYLPLALAQAAVYILDQPGMTCAGYRDHLTDRTLTLDQLSPDTLPDEYPHTIAAALQIAIEHADQYEPVGLASQLLALASLLDPAGIPADLFSTIQYTAQPDLDLTQHQSGGGSSPLPLPPRAVTDTLARLHRLNLIDHDGTTIRIHALVQRTRRDQLDDTEMNHFACRAASALCDAWPEIENDPGRSAALRANVTRLREHAEAALLLGEVHPVLFRQGTSFGENGLVNEAHSHFKNLYQVCISAFGPDHLSALMTRNDREIWRGEAGDPAGATANLKVLLKDSLRILGPDNPHTLAIRNNLAAWLGRSGDVTRAKATLEALRPDLVRLLGPDHPDTLRATNNLAAMRGETGDAAGAAADSEVILAERTRIFGPDHPSTLTARNNLAFWRGLAGDPVGAATALESLLIDFHRTLGPKHPKTLIARANLATLRGASGDTSGAVVALEALVADATLFLGSQHIHVFATRHTLATWRGKDGDVAGAVADFKALVTDRTRILGDQHPHTLDARTDLAYWQKPAKRK